MNNIAGMDNKRTIWVDMDGVLADFDQFVIEKLGKKFAHHGGNDKEMWEFLHKVPNFYFHLKPMTDMRVLWNFIASLGLDTQILTAIPRRTTMPSAEEDKRRWIEKHLGKDVIVKIGPYSRDKWKHAKYGDILIDDRKDNIEDWITKGKGIGILHKNAEDTIEQLKNILIHGMTA